MEDDIWVFEMASKLTGAIFKKALLENSMEKVYSRVLTEITTQAFEDDVHILQIFGDVGGWKGNSVEELTDAEDVAGMAVL